MTETNGHSKFLIRKKKHETFGSFKKTRYFLDPHSER